MQLQVSYSADDSDFMTTFMTASPLHSLLILKHSYSSSIAPKIMFTSRAKLLLPLALSASALTVRISQPAIEFSIRTASASCSIITTSTMDNPVHKP